MKIILFTLFMLFTGYFLLIIPGQPVLKAAVQLQQGLPQGSEVDLRNYFLPLPGKPARISSGELFWIKPGQNEEYIQCTNDLCTSFQKIFLTADGFGIQGENHWNNKDNTTFQYRQGTFRWDDPDINPEEYPHATWLPSNMKVGDTYDSGPVTVVGFIISPDPNEGIISQCDSRCDNTGAGNTPIGTRLTYVGPVDFGSNIQLEDVAIVDVVYGPGAGEKFYFAKDIGWVGWELNDVSNLISQPIGEVSPPADGTVPSPPPPLSTPTPTLVQAQSEELAVYKLKKGRVAPSVEDTLTKADDNLINTILSILSFANLKGQLINASLAFGIRFYSQSETLNKAVIPKQVIQKQENGWLNNLKGFLGGSAGFYGVNLPKIEGVGDKIQDSEKMYEKAYFPKGIKPVTGQ